MDVAGHSGVRTPFGTHAPTSSLGEVGGLELAEQR